MQTRTSIRTQDAYMPSLFPPETLEGPSPTYPATQGKHAAKCGLQAAPKKEKKPAARQVPGYLKSFKLERTVEEFMGNHGISNLETTHSTISLQPDGTLSPKANYWNRSNVTGRSIPVRANAGRYEIVLAWVDQSGACWTNTASFFAPNGFTAGGTKTEGFSLGAAWRVTGRLYPNVFFLQSDDDLKEILQDANRYGYAFVLKEKVDIHNFLMAPYLETLHKAGYRFAAEFFGRDGDVLGRLEPFNRLCQPGTKPKDILKTSKAVATVLKHDPNIQTWDVFRRLDKTGKISQDAVQQVYDAGLSEKELEKINAILACSHGGKKVFTWNSLVNYLGRLDTFEAIRRDHAIDLLKDYLQMCTYLKVAPRIDSDSLWREHNVISRVYRIKQENEWRKQKERDENETDPQKRLENKCRRDRELQAYAWAGRYDYSENVYSIRAIRDFDDLLDEASQQANCVVAYHNMILTGQTFIFTMRETARPDKSLITVELSPDGKTIRQKYLAHNKAIHNRSQTEFLERWSAHLRTIPQTAQP